MQLKTIEIENAEANRKEYLERVAIDQEHKEDILKNLYPKWVAWIEHDYGPRVEFDMEFKGDTQEEVIQLGIGWLKDIRAKIDKIIENFDQNSGKTP